jgi:hypothetical protein
MIRFIARWILALGLLANLQACQQLRTVVIQNDQTRSPDIVSNTPSHMATPVNLVTSINPEGLTGKVVSASDVTGQPDVPLPNQMILAVPIENASEILGITSKIPTNQELRFWASDLPHKDPAIVSTLSDASGNYVLILTPGEYILCVADSEKSPPDFPATIRGCGRVVVQPGVLRRVDISRGFGEILLIGQ